MEDDAPEEETDKPVKIQWETESDTVDQLVKVINRQMDMIETLHKHLMEQNEALFYLFQKRQN